MTSREIDRRFDRHVPKSDVDADACDAIRAKFKAAAVAVVLHCPQTREQAAAITKLEEGLFFAIRAIVRPPSN